MPSRQENIQVGIHFNTSVDKTGIDTLKHQLKEIQNMRISDMVNIDGTKSQAELNKIKDTAVSVEKALENAFNPKLGTINIKEFSKSLNDIGINKIYQDFDKLGAKGRAAFRNLAAETLTTNAQLKTSVTLLDKMGQTFINSAKWFVSSSIINSFSRSIQSAWSYTQKLDASLNDIRIVTGKNADEMERFAVQANKAAQNLGKTTTDYTSASLIYYQQGLSDREVEERTDVTMKLSGVTGQSAKEVSDYMTAIWNNFDNGSESLEHYADVITALGASTAASSAEIANGLQKFAAVAETVGLSYDYATTALATLVAETRQSEDIVGTALKTLFARIQDLELGDTLEDGTTLGKYSQALATIGVNIKDAKGEVKDMNTILDEMGSKWKTLSQDTQVAVAQTVAGTRQYTQLVALMKNWDKFQDNLKVAQDSAGTLQKQQDIYMDSLEAHLKQLQAAEEGLIDSFVDTDSFKDVIDTFTTALTTLNDVIQSLGGGGEVLKGLAGILTVLFSKQISTQISTVVEGLRNFVSTSAAMKQQGVMLQGFLSSNNVNTGGMKDETTQELTTKYNQYYQNRNIMTQEERQAAEALLKDWTESANKLDILNEKAEKLKTIYSNLIGGNLDLSDSFQLDELDQKTKKIVQTLREFQKNAQENSLLRIGMVDDNFMKELENQIEQIKKVLGKESNTVKDLENKYKQLDAARTNSNPQQFAQVWQETNHVLNQSAHEIQNTTINTEYLGQELEETELKVSKLSNAWKTMTSTFDSRQLISAFTTLTGGITSAIFAFNQFHSTLEIINDDSKDTASKVTALGLLLPSLTAVGSSIGQVTQKLALAFGGAEAGVNSFGTAIKFLFTPGPGLIVTAVVTGLALITAGVIKLTKEYDKLHTTVKERSETINDYVEGMGQKADEAKQKYESIKAAFDNYDSVVKVLQECETGTKAWNDALLTVNDTVLSMTRDFPELLRNGWVTQDENGIWTISEEGRQAIVQKNQKNSLAADFAYSQALMVRDYWDNTRAKADLQNTVNEQLDAAIKDAANLFKFNPNIYSHLFNFKYDLNNDGNITQQLIEYAEYLKNSQENLSSVLFSAEEGFSVKDLQDIVQNFQIQAAISGKEISEYRNQTKYGKLHSLTEDEQRKALYDYIAENTSYDNQKIWNEVLGDFFVEKVLNNLDDNISTDINLYKSSFNTLDKESSNLADYYASLFTSYLIPNGSKLNKAVENQIKARLKEDDSFINQLANNFGYDILNVADDNFDLNKIQEQGETVQKALQNYTDSLGISLKLPSDFITNIKDYIKPIEGDFIINNLTDIYGNKIEEDFSLLDLLTFQYAYALMDNQENFINEATNAYNQGIENLRKNNKNKAADRLNEYVNNNFQNLTSQDLVVKDWKTFSERFGSSSDSSWKSTIVKEYFGINSEEDRKLILNSLGYTLEDWDLFVEQFTSNLKNFVSTIDDLAQSGETEISKIDELDFTEFDAKVAAELASVIGDILNAGNYEEITGFFGNLKVSDSSRYVQFLNDLMNSTKSMSEIYLEYKDIIGDIKPKEFQKIYKELHQINPKNLTQLQEYTKSLSEIADSLSSNKTISAEQYNTLFQHIDEENKKFFTYTLDGMYHLVDIGQDFSTLLKDTQLNEALTLIKNLKDTNTQLNNYDTSNLKQNNITTTREGESFINEDQLYNQVTLLKLLGYNTDEVNDFYRKSLSEKSLANATAEEIENAKVIQEIVDSIWDSLPDIIKSAIEQNKETINLVVQGAANNYYDAAITNLQDLNQADLKFRNREDEELNEISDEDGLKAHGETLLRIADQYASTTDAAERYRKLLSAEKIDTIALAKAERELQSIIKNNEWDTAVKSISSAYESLKELKKEAADSGKEFDESSEDAQKNYKEIADAIEEVTGVRFDNEKLQNNYDKIAAWMEATTEEESKRLSGILFGNLFAGEDSEKFEGYLFNALAPIFGDDVAKLQEILNANELTVNVDGTFDPVDIINGLVAIGLDAQTILELFSAIAGVDLQFDMSGMQDLVKALKILNNPNTDSEEDYEWASNIVNLARISPSATIPSADGSKYLKKPSGGGGGGGSKTNPKEEGEKMLKDIEGLEDDLDKYREYNHIIDETTKATERLSKQQDKLRGDKLKRNLQEQVELLNDQIDAYKKKLEFAKEEMALERENLAAEYGAQFDETGYLVNYNEILYEKLAAIKELINTYMETGSEELKEQIEKEKEAYAAIKEALNEYEEDWNIGEELQDSIQAAIDQQIQLQIQAFKVDIEMKLDTHQAKLDWIDFETKVLKDIKDDDFVGLAEQNLKKIYTYIGGDGILQQLRDHLDATVDQLQQVRGGWAEIYGDDEATAFEDAQNYFKELMTHLEDVVDLVKEIEQYVLDLIDKISDAFDENINKLNTINSLLESDIKLVQAFNGSGAILTRYSDMQIRVSEELVRNNLEAAEMWRGLLAGAEEGSDEYKKIYENMMNAYTASRDGILNTIELTKQKTENAIDTIADDIKNTFGVSFDWIRKQWDMMVDRAEKYFDPIERIFNMENLKDTFEDALSNYMLNPRAQSRINSLMNETLDLYKAKDKLTEVDINRAEKRLAILQAQLALEDVEDTKATMRLRRNSRGDYTYQYVANQDDIEAAEDRLRETLQDYYDFERTETQNFTSDILDQFEEMFNDITDMAKDFSEDGMITDNERELFNQAATSMITEFIDTLSQRTEGNESLLKFAQKYFPGLDVSQILQTDPTGIGEYLKTYLTDPESFMNKLVEMSQDILEVSQEGAADLTALIEKYNLADLLNGNDDIASLIWGDVVDPTKLREEGETQMSVIRGIRDIAEGILEEVRSYAGYMETKFEQIYETPIPKLPTDIQGNINAGKNDIQAASAAVAASRGLLGSLAKNTQLTAEEEEALAGLFSGQILAGYQELYRGLIDSTSMSGLTSILQQISKSGGMTNGIVQSVNINADFPNVENAKEIQEAFDNLMNIAIQQIEIKEK